MKPVPNFEENGGASLLRALYTSIVLRVGGMGDRRPPKRLRLETHIERLIATIPGKPSVSAVFTRRGNSTQWLDDRARQFSL